MSLYISSQSNGVSIRNADIPQGDIYFPVLVPGMTTDPLPFVFYVEGNIPVVNLINIKIYLTGPADDIQTLQQDWPNIQANRPDLNGGLEISLDGGRTFIRFTHQYGYAQDPTTWITMPASATAFSNQDGVLNKTDNLAVQLRLVIPPGTTEFRKFNFNLELDCDVR